MLRAEEARCWMPTPLSLQETRNAQGRAVPATVRVVTQRSGAVTCPVPPRSISFTTSVTSVMSGRRKPIQSPRAAAVPGRDGKSLRVCQYALCTRVEDCPQLGQVAWATLVSMTIEVWLSCSSGAI